MENDNMLDTIYLCIIIFAAAVVINIILHGGDTSPVKECCECIKEGVISLGGTK
jgi:hypothetical protein